VSQLQQVHCSTLLSQLQQVQKAMLLALPW
jgi:hypothetical protein